VLLLQPDMEVIAEPQCSGLELLLLLRRTAPDVLVCQPRPGRVLALSQVLSEHPHLTVLAISADGRETTLHRLTLHSVSLSAASLQGVADEIREASQSDSLRSRDG
jgi:DNA-binding NarL/FixJ family response regulator